VREWRTLAFARDAPVPCCMLVKDAPIGQRKPFSSLPSIVRTPHRSRIPVPLLLFSLRVVLLRRRAAPSRSDQGQSRKRRHARVGRTLPTAWPRVPPRALRVLPCLVYVFYQRARQERPPSDHTRPGCLIPHLVKPGRGLRGAALLGQWRGG